MDQFLWIIYPYLMLTICIVGTIYRMRMRPYTWTSKSSQLLESKLLKWGSLLFHWGILFVLAGHFAGLIIPIEFYRSIGISDEAYHIGAIGFGTLAGISVFTGLVILLYRRTTNKRILRTSSRGDFIALVLLFIVVGSGLFATIGSTIVHPHFDYRTTISPWIRGFLTFQPNIELMKDIPWAFKFHIFMSFTLYASIPFTRLVHMFSLPYYYLWRSYVVYRKRTGSSKKFNF